MSIDHAERLRRLAHELHEALPLMPPHLTGLIDDVVTEMRRTATAVELLTDDFLTPAGFSAAATEALR